MTIFKEQNKIFFWDEQNRKLFMSSIIIPEKTLQNMPFFNGDIFLYYKNYVTDFRQIDIGRKRKIDEKFIKKLCKDL